MNTTKCQATNRDGSPCSARPQPGKDVCVWHDPDRASERQGWNRNAGRAKSKQVQARKRVLAGGMELNEVDAALCTALLDVLSGDLEPNIGTAAAGIARSIASVRQAGEIERRLDALEASATQREGQSA